MAGGAAVLMHGYDGIPGRPGTGGTRCRAEQATGEEGQARRIRQILHQMEALQNWRAAEQSDDIEVGNCVVAEPISVIVPSASHAPQCVSHPTTMVSPHVVKVFIGGGALYLLLLCSFRSS